MLRGCLNYISSLNSARKLSIFNTEACKTYTYCDNLVLQSLRSTDTTIQREIAATVVGDFTVRTVL